MSKIDPEKYFHSLIALTVALGEDPTLSAGDSEKNILNNVIKIAGTTGNISNSGSGLLLTTDGFFATARHVLEPHESSWDALRKRRETIEDDSSFNNYIRRQYYIETIGGQRYPIDIAFWASSKSRDIAIAKAVIPGRTAPIRFRVLKDPLQKDQDVKLFGIRDDVHYRQMGEVTHPTYRTSTNGVYTEDSFLTNVKGIEGFSGGVFTTFEGEYAGIPLYKVSCDDGIGDIGGAKISNVVDLGRKLVARVGDMYFDRQY